MLHNRLTGELLIFIEKRIMLAAAQLHADHNGISHTRARAAFCLGLLFRQNKRFLRNLLRSWHLVACTNTIRLFAGVETSPSATARVKRNASVEIPSISGRQKLISDVRPQITILQRVWRGSKNWRVAARR
jgi:hypothetical protein